MKHLNSYFFIVSVLLAWSCTPTDDNSPEPEDVYVKYYGRGTNEAADVVTTSTGEIIILASNTLSGSDADIYLIKTDEEGNETASTLYDIKDGSEDVPQRLKPIGDDLFLLVGYMVYDDADGLDKYDGAWCIVGADLEIKSTGSDTSDFKLIKDVITTDIIQTTETDGVDKYVVLGHSLMTYAGDLVTDGDYQVYMGKYDLSDSVYWEKSHGYAGDDYSVGLFEESDGGLLFVGSTESSFSGFTGRNIYVERTNRLGTSDKTAVRIGVEGALANADDVPYAVIESSLGYSIVGSTQDEDGQLAGFHVAVTPSGESILISGSEVLQNSYGLACEVYAATITQHNELLVTGSIPNFRMDEGEESTGVNRLEEVLTMKASLISGHLEGYDHHYGTTVGDDHGNAVLSLSDGDVLVAATIDFGSGVTMVGLLRLNENGELED